ncbi:helix-turn-helix domain-containing protein [uncultured Hoeflea sp.]|uniref:MarR family transcriptional regulator n=1 Tax=uncultured Hoeflea sp. TaxID=538666 RepID=UPI0026387643|nr:helix-turn-helix domain-containing protein [uncultured Hoeflea sp.]
MAKPFETFPSQTAAIMHFASQGMSVGEIARRMGRSAGFVSNTINQNGGHVARRRINIRADNFEAVSTAAEAHGLSPVALTDRILAIVTAEPVLLENLLDECDG